MASNKKVILIFTAGDGKVITSAATPAIEKLLQKGALFTNVKCDQGCDVKLLAATGAKSGETLWEAAVAQGFVVGNLHETFDMCVLDAGKTPADVEKVLAEAFEVADRSTLVVLVAAGALVFYGPGMAKGKMVDAETCPCVVAPTVAYAANVPVPAQCAGPVAYTALKDINLKLQEIKRFQETIAKMEAAMEHKNRQPWGKHDCA